MEYEIEERYQYRYPRTADGLDWRKIASYMRMIGDMERIADHCCDIAIYVKHLCFP